MIFLLFNIITDGSDEGINDELSEKGHDSSGHGDNIEIGLDVVRREIVDGVF